MYKPDDVYVILPAFNEETVIQKIIFELQEKEFNVLCVVDGCTDNTLAKVLQAQCDYVHHIVNLGQGACLETGFSMYRQGLLNCKLLATFDSDGQHQVGDLLEFLEAFNKHPGIDMVLGSRFLNDLSNVPRLKKLILKFFARMSRYTLGVHVTDRHNGLRMFKPHILEEFSLRTPGYGHADEFLKFIKRSNLSFIEVPTEILYTDYSRSKGQKVINGIKTLFDGVISAK